MNSSPNSPPPADHRSARVLIVDDDVLVIQVISRLLAGYPNKRFATNGRQALRLAQENPPDVVLLDAGLPDIDGLEVCRTLKADPRLADAIVIFVTASTDPALEVRMFECGAADLITKPVNLPVLEARLTAHWRLHQMSREIERLSAEVARLRS